MAILLNNSGYENAPWAQVFARELPEMPVYEFSNVPNRDAIKYAAIWEHPHNDLQNYPNLKAIMVLGAGTDHIDKDPALQQLDVPIVRLVDPDVGIDMAQYVLYWAMHFQRDYERYREASKSADWQRFMSPRAKKWRVTVLGLGRIGEFIARYVSQAGFAAQAWNRSEKQVPAVRVFSGADQLKAVLNETDVLVNCLPLNDDTRGLLGQETLKQLPIGASLINISRGAVVEEEALIVALESGQLANAALDCFEKEPLIQSSPLWEMGNVYITPHMSGATYARSAAVVVAQNIQRMERGEAPYPVHNQRQNYESA